MAAVSNQEHLKKLAQDVYNKLQRLECPLVDDLRLCEAESIQELLCTPSIHRTEILKWICVSVCPEYNTQFDAQTKVQMVKDVNKTLLQFGHELMLCSLNEMDLVKGAAPPLRQLHFLEQLVSLITGTAPSSGSSGINSSGCSIGEDSASSTGCTLQVRKHLSQPYVLEHLHRTRLSPLPSSISQLLITTKTSGPRVEQKLMSQDVSEEKLRETADLLQTVKSSLEDLQKQCDFLTPGVKVPCCPQRSPLALSTARVAASDSQQLMTAFNHIQYDLQGYCKPSPEPPFHTDLFQRTRQLLQATNMEMKAYEHLADTSTFMADTMMDLQEEKGFLIHKEMQSLPAMLDSMSKKYSSPLLVPTSKHEN